LRIPLIPQPLLPNRKKIPSSPSPFSPWRRGVSKPLSLGRGGRG